MSDPTSFNHPIRETLAEADVGRVGSAVLALTRELWVLSDRMAVMEALLERHGIDIGGEIERFEPDAQMQARLDQRGQALVEGILAALAGTEGD